MNGKEKDKAKKDLDKEIEDFKNGDYEGLKEAYDKDETRDIRKPGMIYSPREIAKKFAEVGKKKKVKKWPK